MAQIINAFFGLGLSPLDCLFLDAGIVPAFLALLGAAMIIRAVCYRRAMTQRLNRYRAEARAERIAAENMAALESEINACLAELNS